MTAERAIEVLDRLDAYLENMYGGSPYSKQEQEVFESIQFAIGELEKRERIKSIMTMLSVQAELNRVVLAKDIFDVLEDVFDDWSEEERKEQL